MKHYTIHLLLASLLLTGSVCVKAQTANLAAAHYNRFVQRFSDGAKSDAYDALYQSYEAYAQLLSSPAATAAHPQAKMALKNMFPYLEQAAYYYSSLNDQTRTLQFAQAYVGLSVMPAMQDQGLTLSTNHVMLTKVAVSGAWRSGNLEKAIPMLSAYLKTGDTSMRREAYNNLGVAYSKQKQYAQSKVVLEEGLRAYPGDLTMLITMVDNANKSADDQTLQTYLPQVLAILPSSDRRMPTLLNMQGALQERLNQYEQAVTTYTRLRAMMPQDLNTARHLSQNCFNAGVYYFKLSKESTSKSLQKQYREQANSFFLQSEPIFQSIMASDPLSVKYAFALATVYSCLGEKVKLQAINEKIAALGYAPVAAEQMVPSLMAMNEQAPPQAVKRQPVTAVAVQPATPVAATQQPVMDGPSPLPPAIADVDIDIPERPADNENTFAVIIANEAYNKVAKVAMANNDGKVFAEYCRKVLGMPQENVRTYFDATALEMVDALEGIKRIAAVYKGKLNVIFYYAGHGVPDEVTKDAFLLPVDANGQRTTGCLSLNKLYHELASLGANQVTVFLDACFSGSQRGEGMLASARGVAIKPKSESARGNMVVFSAATDAQTAMPFEEKQHGLFTYFLLKKLKDTQGECTLSELGEYIKEKVSQRAEVINKKTQTPTITPSAELGERWKNFKLIKQ